MKNKRLIFMVLIVLILLSIPLIAMQFTNEVNWNSFDFIVSAGLLLGAGLVAEIIMRKIVNYRHKLILLVATLIILVLIRTELAVGIFGTPFAGS